MSSNQQPESPRHWHGAVGDRHEHHNVWVRGGPAQAYQGRRPSMTETVNAMADRRVCLHSFLLHQSYIGERQC